METLAPRDLYDNDELGITARLPLITGILFGIGMTVLDLADALGDGVPLADAMVPALLIGAVSGAVFGWLFRGMGGMARRAMDRWYAGDPAIVPPPADAYLYRLPCSVLGASNRVVSGVLYVGPRGLRFDPLLRYPAALREPLAIEPLRDIQLELVQTPLPRWLWVSGRRTLPRIQARWPGGEARFGIPDAPGVLATLQYRVDALKQAAVSGG